jgi:hypothetical protein
MADIETLTDGERAYLANPRINHHVENKALRIIDAQAKRIAELEAITRGGAGGGSVSRTTHDCGDKECIYYQSGRPHTHMVPKP